MARWLMHAGRHWHDASTRHAAGIASAAGCANLRAPSFRLAGQHACYSRGLVEQYQRPVGSAAWWQPSAGMDMSGCAGWGEEHVQICLRDEQSVLLCCCMHACAVSPHSPASEPRVRPLRRCRVDFAQHCACGASLASRGHIPAAARSVLTDGRICARCRYGLRAMPHTAHVDAWSARRRPAGLVLTRVVCLVS